MGFDPFVYWEFKSALDQLELAKINAERELIGLPPLMPLSDSVFSTLSSYMLESYMPSGNQTALCLTSVINQ